MMTQLVLVALSLVCVVVLALARRPITWRSLKTRIEAEWQALSSEPALIGHADREQFTQVYRREIIGQLCRHSALIGIPALLAFWVASMAYLVILPMTVVDLVVWCVIATSGILLFAFMALPRYFLDEENFYFERARVRVLRRLGQ